MYPVQANSRLDVEFIGSTEADDFVRWFSSRSTPQHLASGLGVNS